VCTGSLREFARLVELARLRRGLVRPDPDGDDIPDPMSLPLAAHHHAAQLIHATVADVGDIVVPLD
jgi:hypothetical protein